MDSEWEGHPMKPCEYLSRDLNLSPHFFSLKKNKVEGVTGEGVKVSESMH